MPDYDPNSYGYREGVLGQIPNDIRVSTIRLHSGVGVPSASLGANGDYFFRSDGAAGAHIYFKAAGAWGAIV